MCSHSFSWSCYAVERHFWGGRYQSLTASETRPQSLINQGLFCPYCVTEGIKKAASLCPRYGGLRNAAFAVSYLIFVMLCQYCCACVILLLYSLLGFVLTRISRAYQSSFRKSSKLVVNWLWNPANMPINQGFFGIINFFKIKKDLHPRRLLFTTLGIIVPSDIYIAL